MLWFLQAGRLEAGSCGSRQWDLGIAVSLVVWYLALGNEVTGIVAKTVGGDRGLVGDRASGLVGLQVNE